MNGIMQLQRIIDKSKNIVFFGGAGVSTESGIPDFRSANGLYHQEWDYPPETILCRSFFDSQTAEFYRFYKKRLIIKNATPNAAHLKLAELEKVGKVQAVITQNIDGLHQDAGSRNVYELHGSLLRNYCTNCGGFYTMDEVVKNCEKDGIPHCSKTPGCTGIVKPDVVLYEESLNSETLSKSINAITKADTLIIGGTSLVVYPAASLVQYFCGENLVLINKGETGADKQANLIVRDNIGRVFSEIHT